MNKLFLFPLLFLSTWALAQDSSIPQESFRILETFQENGKTLSAQATREIPEKIHKMILEGENRFLQSLNGECKEKVEVTFGPKIFGSADATVRAFESGLVRIEASKCYTNADPSELIRISGQPDFKKAAFSTLRNISTPQQNISCETTYAPTIGNSQYCYLSVDLVKNSDRASQTSFLIFNKQDLDAPVYFREAYVSARKLGDQTLYYVHSYVRSTKLGTLKRHFATSYISDTQKHVFEKLGNSLRSDGSK